MPLRALPPQGSASASFATWAFGWKYSRAMLGSRTEWVMGVASSMPAGLLDLLGSAGERVRGAGVEELRLGG